MEKIKETIENIQVYDRIDIIFSKFTICGFVKWIRFSGVIMKISEKAICINPCGEPLVTTVWLPKKAFKIKTLRKKLEYDKTLWIVELKKNKFCILINIMDHDKARLGHAWNIVRY